MKSNRRCCCSNVKSISKQRRANSTTFSLAHLPVDIVQLILNRLCPHDMYNCRSVCQTWRAAAKQCSLSPGLVVSYQSKECTPFMINVLQSKKCDINMHGFDESYCVGSSFGWLVMRGNNSSEFFLLNAVSGSTVKLPRLSSEIKSVRICLSSPPTSSDCTVLLIKKTTYEFAIWKLGDEIWKVKKYPYASSRSVNNFLEQVVALGGKFYALTTRGELLTTDYVSSCKITTIYVTRNVRPLTSVLYHQFLVESQGDILVVFLCYGKYYQRLDGVEVYRMDFKTSSWIKMESLGDRVLFVGYNCSFSVAAGIMGSRGDYVFLTNHGINYWSVFDMKRKKFITDDFGMMAKGYQNNRIWVMPTVV